MNSLEEVFWNFLVPARSSISTLNGGVVTLYEICGTDAEWKLENLNLFFLLLEVYGTGRSVFDDGSMSTISQ